MAGVLLSIAKENHKTGKDSKSSSSSRGGRAGGKARNDRDNRTPYEKRNKSQHTDSTGIVAQLAALLPRQAFTSTSGSSGTSRNMAEVECNYCHKFGHYKSDCPQALAKAKSALNNL